MTMNTPLQSIEAGAYHEALAQGQLLLQTCAQCSSVRHPPSPMCPVCQSVRVRWQACAGAGIVHSAVTIHHTSLPGYRQRTPYTVLTVTLDEQVRILAPLAFDAQTVPAIGARVVLTFMPQADGSTLATFRASA